MRLTCERSGLTSSSVIAEDTFCGCFLGVFRVQTPHRVSSSKAPTCHNPKPDKGFAASNHVVVSTLLPQFWSPTYRIVWKLEPKCLVVANVGSDAEVNGNSGILPTHPLCYGHGMRPLEAERKQIFADVRK